MAHRLGPGFIGVASGLDRGSVGGSRSAVTSALRVEEVARLSSSPAGVCDLALVQALGQQFRYLRRDQVDLFYPGLSPITIGKRLGLLWRHQWVDRIPAPGTHEKHPAQIYRLGLLGKDWLNFGGTPSRWVVRPGDWAGNVDPTLAHWLGIADIWGGLRRGTLHPAWGGALTVSRFQTELDYKFGKMEARTSWKPDGVLELSWGQTLAETFVAYFEYDRDTEPLSRWVTNKIENARLFGYSPQWPWRGIPVAYWVFVPTLQRLRAIKEILHQPPFGTTGDWVLIPWDSWVAQGLSGQRDWVVKRDDRASANRWEEFRRWTINRSREYGLRKPLQKP